jgi:hypothetical protein
VLGLDDLGDHAQFLGAIFFLPELTALHIDQIITCWQRLWSGVLGYLLGVEINESHLHKLLSKK